MCCFYIFQAMDLFDIGEGYRSLDASLSRVKCPVMVIGVQTDHKTASTNDSLPEISKMKYRNQIPELGTTISGFADS
jgi:homoserine acetyltransferase